MVVAQIARRHFREIPLEMIESPPNPSREVFEDIKVLAATIEEHGLLEPILVKKMIKQFGYRVVCGERRLRACRKAGLQSIPCIVLDGVSDEQILEIQLIENLQRADLKTFEEIKLIESLKEQFHLSNDEISVKTGIPPTAVRNYLLISKALPLEYVKMISYGSHNPKDLTVKKALVLARSNLPADMLKELVDLIRKSGLTRDALARKLATTQKKKIKRVAAARTFWKELTRNVKDFARYWPDYSTLKEWEDIKQYHLMLEVTMPKDLGETKT
jgi:ParB/RepB/Spo0J family partition protein